MKSILCSLFLTLSLATAVHAKTLSANEIEDMQMLVENQALEIEQLAHENNILHQEIKQLKAQNNLLLQRIDSLSANANKETAKPIAPPISAQETPYEQGKKLYQNKQYLQAISTLKYSANGGDGSANAQDAMYLLSLSHQQLRHCEAAIDIGKRFVDMFPNNSKAPNALYNVANCQTYLQQKDIAKNTLNQLIRIYPNSTAAKRAQSKIK